MKWAALTKVITLTGLFMPRILQFPKIGYMVLSRRDVANDYRRDANCWLQRGQPPGDRRWRASGGAQLPQGYPARHPHASRGATGLCGPGYHAGDHAKRPLA